MKKVVALITAAAFAAAAVIPARAAILPGATPGVVVNSAAPSGAVASQIIMGFGAASTLSLMLCSAVIKKRFKRDMSSAEAAKAALLPFSCLFAP